jgi:hypothetical protein
MHKVVLIVDASKDQYIVHIYINRLTVQAG